MHLQMKISQKKLNNAFGSKQSINKVPLTILDVKKLKER